MLWLRFGVTALGYHGILPIKKGPDMAPDIENEQIKQAVALATKLYGDDAVIFLAAALRFACTNNQFNVFLQNLEMDVAQ